MILKLGASQFQALVRKQGGAKVDDELLVVKASPFIDLKAINRDLRTIDFVISDEGVDRDNDTLRLSGWDLAHYKRNPVVLFAHDHWSLPIGRASELVKDKASGQLRSKTHFIEEELSPFAETVFQFYARGYLSATSVGFKPTEWEPAAEEDNRKWGLNYLKQELLEYSAVPVPSNPRALTDGKACEDGMCGALTHAREHGVNIAPFKTAWEQSMDEASAVAFMGFDREALDRMRSIVFGKAAALVLAAEVKPVKLDCGCENTCGCPPKSAVIPPVAAVPAVPAVSAATDAELTERIRAVITQLKKEDVKEIDSPEFFMLEADPDDIGVTEAMLRDTMVQVLGAELRAQLNTITGRVD
jgi:HK97 family phage prohead protease